MRTFLIVLMATAAAFCAAAVAARDTSDACLTCHNGTKAPRMESSHPYAIDYARAAAHSKSKFRNAQSPSGFGGTIAQDLLVNGNVECSTCHVAHEEEADNPFRLRSRDVVKLCTSCHVMR